MPYNASHIESLFNKFSKAEASQEEVRELFQLIEEGKSDPELVRLMQNGMELESADPSLPAADKERVMGKIRDMIRVIEGESFPATGSGKKGWTWLVAAAGISVMLGMATWVFFRPSSTGKGQAEVFADVAPGKHSATLTLSDGKKILLNDAVSGELAKEAGMRISKTADGQVIYEMIGGAKNTSALGTMGNRLNTLSTAKGETYQLRLPDGSKVWLNAASSLSYSTGINELGASDQRVVSLSGEAYFEVKKNKAHAFVVKTATQQVTVLGTHFNVNSYGDQGGTKTTLLEGSVRVAATAGAMKVLHPGEQAVLSGKELRVQQVEAEDVVAWKDGTFVFNNEPLSDVMQQIARWYDIEVVYADAGVKERLFFGSIGRFENISKVLEVLQRTDVVDFKLEGKKVIVGKKK